MHRKPVLLLAVFCLLFAVSCTPQYSTSPEPSAQELFDSGMRAFNQEQYQVALSNFEQAVMKSPGFVDAQFYAGLSAWKLNMVERAKRSFLDALRLDANHVKTREALGILYYSTGEFDRARQQLEAARSLNSVNPEVYLDLGRIYVMEGRCPEALQVFEKGLQVDSSYLPLKNEYDAARHKCGKGGPAKPPVIHEKTFRGGGKAIDPSDF